MPLIVYITGAPPTGFQPDSEKIECSIVRKLAVGVELP